MVLAPPPGAGGAVVRVTGRLLPLCVVPLLHGVPSPAVAQAEPTALPQVVVTGQRMLPEAARIGEPVPEVRLDRSDFTRLPADRASDIIPRLPGVVVSGPPGERKNFGLRGLTPDYTRVQIDGIQLPSAAGSRSLEPTMLPGFLLQSVGILRNPSAEHEADGIGGRILIETRPVPPRDAIELRGALGGNNRLVDGFNQQAGALYARRFSDHFGVLGAINVDRRRIFKIKNFSEVTFQGGPGGQGQIIDERDPKDFTSIDALGQLGWVWGTGQLTIRPTLLHTTVDNDKRRDTYRRDTGAFLNRQLGEGEERLTVGSLSIGLRQTLVPSLTLSLDLAGSTAQLGKDGLTDREFLLLLLRSAVREMADSEHAHGLVMTHINRGPFLNHVVAIPPLAEQLLPPAVGLTVSPVVF